MYRQNKLTFINYYWQINGNLSKTNINKVGLTVYA